MTYPNILFILADDLGCWSLGYTVTKMPLLLIWTAWRAKGW